MTVSSSLFERDEIERVVFLIRRIVEAENTNGDEAEHNASGFEDIGLKHRVTRTETPLRRCPACSRNVNLTVPLYG